MDIGTKVKGGIFLLAIIIAGWQLSYTWKYRNLSEEEIEELTPEELKKLRDRAIKLGLDLQGGMHLLLKVDLSKLEEKEKRGATDRALYVLRNRINQFGVSEPHIAKQGTDYIVIQLPGVVDKLRAKDIIGKTAQLEFRLVEKRETFEEILKKIDEYIYEKLKTEKDTSEMLEQPLLSLLYDGKVAEGDTSLFMTYIRTEGTKELIPSDVEILWSKTGEVIGVEEYLEPLLVKKKPCLTGDAIVEAVAGIGTSQNPIGARVDLVMKASARHKWARITGANVGRRIAIVMDGVVQSAPVVRERIVGGNSMIDMGGASFEEAQDLALIIRAGALPAPVKIIEERTVGASLGEDSIRKGIQAVYIGGGAILLFMVIYYSACGLLANLALVFNLLFLLAILSGFKATLTLPGIAGILLVVGTAVDANILIFERIREELRAGRTVRSAIDAGYSRAFRTIIDANVTTFLVGLILYYFGTGPIKGFAITLMIGIVANIFTAIVLTKLILDYLVYKGVRRIAI